MARRNAHSSIQACRVPTALCAGVGQVVKPYEIDWQHALRLPVAVDAVTVFGAFYACDLAGAEKIARAHGKGRRGEV